MTTSTNTAVETIYYKGTMGFVPNLLATIVNFSLLVHPDDHTVSGTVRISDGTDKKTYVGKVSGTVYAAGVGEIVRVLHITGNIPADIKDAPLQLSFEANMALKADWNGEGGFSFLGKHEEGVPVKADVFKL
ncbi:protein of unknown function [Tenacibaculum sp. MAR_2009_124]|uniref:DUF1842 domain-containing protein n=1 Tax=Tenacibaculum sp. MAR_2009_124 TaxID=1250059 RepID=UPI000895A8E3|nr:DUF1842 domain-containing protein [Tenacibaculum sp. MAR_2009_124]SED08678.1 protein of unknown function [Tenacibaculum sp. MAR_2009_124]